jgi:nitrogenase iron protein NifH
MQRIAIYGKGGIGKSTVTANLSAAFARRGSTVMQIGCDPKADSTRMLTGGEKIPAVLEVMRDSDGRLGLKDIVFPGISGTLCVECGGPTPGLGCAGWGIIAAFRKLDELKAFETYDPGIVLYDILGDVVCGGFAMPMRDGYAREIVVVTSGEPMSLFAARNIIMAIENFKSRGYARLRGIVQNSRNVEDEDALVDSLVEEAGTELLGRVPRDGAVQEWEKEGKTVVEGNPDSPLGKCFAEIAAILERTE